VPAVACDARQLIAKRWGDLALQTKSMA